MLNENYVRKNLIELEVRYFADTVGDSPTKVGGGNAATQEILDDIVEQTQYVFKNIGILLNEVGLDYSHIVKTTVYLTDMNDFSKVNEEYEKYFKKIYPARSCIEISRLPKGGKVEIECIACY